LALRAAWRASSKTTDFSRGSAYWQARQCQEGSLVSQTVNAATASAALKEIFGMRLSSSLAHHSNTTAHAPEMFRSSSSDCAESLNHWIVGFGPWTWTLDSCPHLAELHQTFVNPRQRGARALASLPA